jgi:hypothetical protein
MPLFGRDNPESDAGTTWSPGKRRSFDCRTTWIGRRSAEGRDGLREIRIAVEALYTGPLCQALGLLSGVSPERQSGVVREILRQIVRRDDFFAVWYGSGMRLRRWLLLELVRHLGGAQASVASLSAAVRTSFDRDCARAFVVEALSWLRQDLAPRIFETFLDGVRGLPPVGCRRPDALTTALLRGAERRFRALLRSLLERDGCHESEIDEDLSELAKTLSESTTRLDREDTSG